MKILTNRKYQELLSCTGLAEKLSITMAQNRIENDMYRGILKEYGIEILEDKVEKSKKSFHKVRMLHLKKGNKERFACCEYLLEHK